MMANSVESLSRTNTKESARCSRWYNGNGSWVGKQCFIPHWYLNRFREESKKSPIASYEYAMGIHLLVH